MDQICPLLKVFLEIIAINSKLLITNSFNYRNLAIREIKYYWPKNLIKAAEKMVKDPLNSTYKKKASQNESRHLQPKGGIMAVAASRRTTLEAPPKTNQI